MARLQNKKHHENNMTESQRQFFDANAARGEVNKLSSPIFDKYVNKEQRQGLTWIANRKVILEYGCGTGDSLDILFEKRNPQKYTVYGVDIAKQAVEKSQKKYPSFHFYTIKNNKIPQLKNGSIEAAFMFHILHHSTDHRDIFKEVRRVLKPEGRFLINDLSSKNPILQLFRGIFIRSPKFVKDRFSDDLVCDDHIPDKYRVGIDDIVKQLEECGFKIEEVGHGHLFFFIFGWVDRFIPFSKISFIRSIYQQLMKFEQWLLSFKIFQSRAEVFFIKAVKV